MKKLPIGIENFKELIDKGYYYVDKTMWIKDVLSEKLVSYTRPRRFGKTLNMSMLYYFFSNKEKDNAYLFDNLEIYKEQEIMKHQNQYPVIFISLKDMIESSFEAQMDRYTSLVSDIVKKNKELFDSTQIDDADKDILRNIKYRKGQMIDLKESLYRISQCLQQHYHQKVIILIDEYDVPLHAIKMDIMMKW